MSVSNGIIVILQELMDRITNQIAFQTGLPFINEKDRFTNRDRL